MAHIAKKQLEGRPPKAVESRHMQCTICGAGRGPFSHCGTGRCPSPPKFEIFDLQKAYFRKLLSAKNLIYNQKLSKTRTHGMHSVWLMVDM